ncbi:MAG TPA: hypothetical protein VGN32_11160 [Ktedonobacterales bacterium]|jgi:hypothetical protein|nr:hypothetical protein [Ktedonobacterales bacterium]
MECYTSASLAGERRNSPGPTINDLATLARSLGVVRYAVLTNCEWGPISAHR